MPEGSDPTTDFFKKKEDERKEKVAKTEFQRLKNLSTGQRGRKVKGSCCLSLCVTVCVCESERESVVSE